MNVLLFVQIFVEKDCKLVLCVLSLDILNHWPAWGQNIRAEHQNLAQQHVLVWILKLKWIIEVNPPQYYSKIKFNLRPTTNIFDHFKEVFICYGGVAKHVHVVDSSVIEMLDIEGLELPVESVHFLSAYQQCQLFSP